MSEAAEQIDERLKTRCQGEGRARIWSASRSLRRNASESDEPLQPHERDHDLQNMNGIPDIDHVNLTGPYIPPALATRRAAAASYVADRRRRLRESACARAS
jgi:hypothetical protein